MPRARELAADLVPPLALRWIRRLRRRHGWFGDFPTWAAAAAQGSGYDSEVILERVATALGKVKRGEAAYERDSVLFDSVQYSWPLLAGLMWAAAQDGGALRLLDFGGSLGSTYFQNRAFLGPLRRVEWSVIEQPAFVERGRADFADERLRFYGSLDQCLAVRDPTVLLLSSVVQYLEDPHAEVAALLRHPFSVVIVDLTPFSAEDRDRICIQRTPADIYPADYPCRLLGRRRFMELFAPHFEVVEHFTSPLGIDVGRRFTPYEGFILRRRSADTGPSPT
jgi:putative methyltransferase (TIGR04325 family)